jgi:hypothetical protein
MNKRVPEKPFAAIMYVAAAASAAYMIYTSASLVAIGYGAGILALAVLVLVIVDKQVLKKVEPTYPCSHCGYEMRGTLAAGRRDCPECGTAFAEVSPD